MKWQGVAGAICEIRVAKVSIFQSVCGTPHQSAPMSSMFDLIRERISCHDIRLGTKLRPNSGKNKYASHGLLSESHCSPALRLSRGIVSHISTSALTCVPCVAAAVWAGSRREASRQILYTRQTVRRWKTVRQR